MPQLDPNPWLFIFFFGWLALLTVVPLKIVPHLSPNEVTRKYTHQTKNTTWTWPWQ